MPLTIRLPQKGGSGTGLSVATSERTLPEKVLASNSNPALTRAQKHVLRLHYAQDLEIIDTVPRIKALKMNRTDVEFLDFDEYAALVDAAR